MGQLTWGPQPYDHGVSRGVLYTPQVAIPWNGLIAITETETAEDTLLYFDGQGYLVAQGNSSFSGSIEAFTYPEEFELFERSASAPFGLSYRTGYGESEKIHILYNVTARTSLRTSKTTGNSLEMSNFSWDITATPEKILRSSPSVHLVIDVDTSNANALGTLESWLYGASGVEPFLPEVSNILTLFEYVQIVTVTDHGDGTWTAEGPDEMIQMIDDDVFQLDVPSHVYIDTTVYIARDY